VPRSKHPEGYYVLEVVDSFVSETKQNNTPYIGLECKTVRFLGEKRDGEGQDLTEHSPNDTVRVMLFLGDKSADGTARVLELMGIPSDVSLTDFMMDTPYYTNPAGGKTLVGQCKHKDEYESWWAADAGNSFIPKQIDTSKAQSLGAILAAARAKQSGSAYQAETGSVAGVDEVPY
jgi:hypothetical protein